MERNSRKLIKLLEGDGWKLVAVAGSHHQFEHPGKKGKTTVTHRRKDLPIGLAGAILKQAGLPTSSK
ncbi:MAG: type II toxin-antitoxin system HicA family toxin [Devosia sp.]|nr:type II toxin-antitoxin system HicA family toxin [Devosia sp.]